MDSDSKRIVIEETEDSPEIILDIEERLLKITGPSFPEDAYETFQPVLRWLDAIGGSVMKLTCEFEFTILSSASNKLLFEMLLKIEDMYQAGKDVIIFWLHDDYDEDMQEEGESFAQAVHVPFKFIAN
ncbi:MAG: DUF1987 domain-containing protein [Bacteroidota bacterium]|nr:DUF1987 domain-containing protein [Bacteroidota bacterium]